MDSPKNQLFFSVLDAWNGYHSIGLTDEDKKYFGFATKWGTYTYNVAPQGYLGSGDYYTKKIDEVMERIINEYPMVSTIPAQEAMRTPGAGSGASTTLSYWLLH